jgi:hypothetical protein
MRRLKKIKANHVSPYVHNIVEDMVYNSHIEKQQDRDAVYLFVDQLFDDSSAYIQDSYSAHKFAERIKQGYYDYISSIEDAESCWNQWLEALHSFLADIKVTAKKKL